MEEKIKLDIEYQMEELKNNIQSLKSSEEIIRKIDRLEKYIYQFECNSNSKSMML
ncbi:MAG: hypothetical protein HQK96_20005 [Nitrospirae bacterium]|nr:hypothetical protein [Nitrospirota bacterium]